MRFGSIFFYYTNECTTSNTYTDSHNTTPTSCDKIESSSVSSCTLIKTNCKW